LQMHANFAAVQTMDVLIFLPSSVSSKLDRQSHQLLWQAVAKNFSHIGFCRPNARWLSHVDDFVYKTRSILIKFCTYCPENICHSIL